MSGSQIAGVNAAELTWSPPTTGGAATSYVVTRESYDIHTLQPATACGSSGNECSASVYTLSHDTHSFSVEARNSEGRGPASHIAVPILATTANHRTRSTT